MWQLQENFNTLFNSLGIILSITNTNHLPLVAVPKQQKRKVYKTHYFVSELLTNYFPIPSTSPIPDPAYLLLTDICISNIRDVTFILYCRVSNYSQK
jgi:hypothetical protein